MNHDTNEGSADTEKWKKILQAYNYTIIENHVFNLLNEHTIYPPPVSPRALISNEDFCSKTLDGIIYVHSAVGNFENRKAIRATWGNKTLLGNKYKLLFVVGKHKVASRQRDLLKENIRYRDILQGDFLDSYHNITYKVVSALNWLQNHCKGTKLLIKSDDDNLINPKLLFQMLQPNWTRRIWCPIFNNSQIQRQPEDKWYTPADEYPGEVMFPPYCRGIIYIFTMDLVQELNIAMRHTAFHWIDDVWFTGAVLDKLLNVEKVDIVHLVRYDHSSDPVSTGQMAVHTQNLTQFARLWKDMEKHCDRKM